jgi:glycerol-3-phosphate cytidylyltransferase-like family protein
VGRQVQQVAAAAVFVDVVVEKLKGKRPINDEAMRIKALLDVDDVDLVYLGDKNEGTYNIVKEVKPSIIYLGYDQTDLSEDLKKAIKEGTIPEIEIKQGVSYKGDTLHSSLLNKL